MKLINLNSIKILAFLLILNAWQAVYTKTMCAQSWQTVSYLPMQETIELIAVHPHDPNLMFLGTERGLFLSTDRGKDWKQTFQLGPNSKINDVYFDDRRILLLTSEGIFQSKNNGKKWDKVFESHKTKEKFSRRIARHPEHRQSIFLATNEGLFLSSDNGRKWTKIVNELGRQSIFDIQPDVQNKELFIASQKGLYRILLSNEKLDRVFVIKTAFIRDLDSLEETEETLEDDRSLEPNEVRKIVLTSSNQVAIATSNGVYVSEDEGNYWERLPTSGLKSLNIKDLIYSSFQNSFYAATDKGVYLYDPALKHWQELRGGLNDLNIKRLSIATKPVEILYAVGDRQAYQWVGLDSIQIEEPHPFPETRWNLALRLFSYEPSVQETQQHVLRNANLSNWKIKRWHLSSRLKALVPSLSVGKSFSKSDTVDIDRGSTTDPDRYILGPSEKNKDWNMDLNWNLSELIWSSAQTSIDSRDKLMVELRDDMLSELTRLYYERRRAQVEFLLRRSEDPYEQTIALMRMDELTAYLDGMSGGFFQKKLNRIYREHPEFETLWLIETASQE